LGDEENIEETMTLIEINLGINPYENAGVYYKQRAKWIEKESKTVEATVSALKNAKETAIKQIKKHQNAQRVVHSNRKPFWFEKFYWFISSENFLVISARDSQQNEMLIKKYTRKDDIVFHTQIQGSAFTVVKNIDN
jgi:predicted ribosome quality control (RQC) complex YloA/Tae2 family protein